jgi:hypothetical protein
VFLHGGMTILCKSCKQTLIDTSTNNSEIIELYEAAHECEWLRKVINHIQDSYGIEFIRSPTIIYEDNVVCIAQMQSGYVKIMLLNTLQLNFSTHMNFKLIRILVSCKLSHVIIWLICLLSPYHAAHFLNMLLILVCVSLKIYRI